MPRISPNNRVRRCLFPEALQDQARVDNFANILQESSARDLEEKSRKWNFDFKNEIPLDGPYEWFRKDGDNWIGMKTICEDFDKKKSLDDNKFLPIQFENENTPVHARDKTIPLIRKRKNDLENKVNNQAKRRIDFDECYFLRRHSDF